MNNGAIDKKKIVNKLNLINTFLTEHTFKCPMKMVAKIAAPGLIGVLAFTGGRYLAIPQSVAHLDGRSRCAALRILAVGRRVGNVVEEPTGIGDTPHFGCGALRS